ncbi:hypothetical protein MPTK1_7g18910 [Marchantia polymorpha subsp. ruderalis]|uniref:Uncharacterized protein n=1 Tax=Marchantia polymorpha subsp. ruderalis TaxID=1480154 RepID=A0AAF6C191_MARPO|nr:hypothetical protein Mp_7g18910 [Marchantia polymorpha subsp. ruderalis]
MHHPLSGACVPFDSQPPETKQNKRNASPNIASKRTSEDALFLHTATSHQIWTGSTICHCMNLISLRAAEGSCCRSYYYHPEIDSPAPPVVQ